MINNLPVHLTRYPKWQINRRLFKYFFLRVNNPHRNRTFIVRTVYLYEDESVFHWGRRVSYKGIVLKQIIFISYSTVI
jgi:hypothetical protein